MYNDKRVGKTIHLPQSMWDKIEERGNTVLRSRSKEVEYSLKTLWDKEDAADKKALSMAEEAQQKRKKRE